MVQYTDDIMISQ